MKIIILTPNYPRQDANMNGIFIHQQIKALGGQGVDCHVLLTYNWYPPFGLHRLHSYWRRGFDLKKSFLTNHEGVHIHHVPVAIKLPSRFFPEDPYHREAKAIFRYIKRNKHLKNADWIYAHFLTDSGYIGTIVKKLLGIKLAVIARGDDVHAWPKKNPWLISHIREVIESADLLLANSKVLANDTIEWAEKKPRFDIRVVYNGIDGERYKPIVSANERLILRKKFGLPLQNNLLLCVAAPIELKGWLELFDAIQKIGNDFANWKLIAVTPGRDYLMKLDLNAEVVKRGIDDRFVLLGQVDTELMPDCYNAMDAFVLASHNEGLSNAVLEAMASGLPVITTNVGGHREFIVNGENGVLVDPFNVDMLTEAIFKVIRGDGFRHHLSLNARRGALSLGSYESNAFLLKQYLSKTEG